MRIAITGASGLIGTALSHRLTADGHDVVPVVRRAPGDNEIGWSVDEQPHRRRRLRRHRRRRAPRGCRHRRQALDRRLQARDPRESHGRHGARREADHRGDRRSEGAAVGLGDRHTTAPAGRDVHRDVAAGTGFLADVCVDWEAAAAPATGAGVRVAYLRTGIVLSADGGALKKQLPLFKFGLGGKMGSRRSVAELDPHRRRSRSDHAPAHGRGRRPRQPDRTEPGHQRRVHRHARRRARPADLPPDPEVRPEAAARWRTRRQPAVQRPEGRADRARSRAASRSPTRRSTAHCATCWTSERVARRGAPVVIVGAGLAGLSCAVHLHEAGHRVEIYEASDGVGGRVRSDHVDGFTLDRGFQVALDRLPRDAPSARHGGARSPGLRAGCPRVAQRQGVGRVRSVPTPDAACSPPRPPRSARCSTRLGSRCCALACGACTRHDSSRATTSRPPPRWIEDGFSSTRWSTGSSGRSSVASSSTPS